METSEKLIKAWPIVKWLDDARWNIGASSSLIPGDVFASLEPSSQILTHWLCYITDQRRPWQGVWSDGGPIFAEIVRDYERQYKSIEDSEDLLELLSQFTLDRGTVGGIERVDAFQAKHQRQAGEVIKFTPNDGRHLVSISRTLYNLVNFDGSIIHYLLHNGSFVFGPSLWVDDKPFVRMVFLLYLLSYDDIHKGKTSFQRYRDEFAHDLERYRQKIESLMQKRDTLDDKFSRWLNCRFHKRLWAACRDYVKLGSYHQPIFQKALEAAKAKTVVDFFVQNRKEVLRSLELPGDTWNLTFNKSLFDNKINSPRDLRLHYNRLRAQGRLSDEFYPEQFDVSWDYARRICDQQQELLCLFKSNSLLKKLCLGGSRKGETCPVIEILCGYRVACSSSGCPVAEDTLVNICSGCY